MPTVRTLFFVIVYKRKVELNFTPAKEGVKCALYAYCDEIVIFDTSAKK